MSKLLRRFTYIFFIVFLVFAGCTMSNNRDNEKNKPVVSDEEEAKQTVIRYLKAVNDNDYDEQLRYLSSKMVNMFEQDWKKYKVKYEYVKITNITPDESEKSKVDYLKREVDYSKHVGVQFTKPVGLAFFNVDFEYKIIYPGVDRKKLNWKYTLIKEKENESWKIDGWGIGWDNVPPPDWDNPAPD